MLSQYIFSQQSDGVKCVVQIIDSSKNNTGDIIDDFLKEPIFEDTSSIFFDSMIENQQKKLFTKLKGNNLKSTTGNLQSDFSYGLLTSYVGPETNRPLFCNRKSGDLGLNVAGIPISLAFNYSTLKNPIGVNNYFRFSVDFDQWKDLEAKKKSELQSKIVENQNKILESQGKLKGKMGFAEILIQKLQIEQTQLLTKIENENIEKIRNEHKLDTLETIQKYQSRIDSVELQIIERKKQFEENKVKLDKLKRRYVELLEIYENYETIYENLNNRKDLINEKLNPELMTQAPSFLNSIKKVNIGLVYPQTSGISKNSIPMKGLELEFQKKNWFTSVSAGASMNNLFVSNNVIQNQLYNTQNLFNNFDFQNIKTSRLLANIKSGLGTKEGKHILLGVRYSDTNPFAKFGSGDSLNHAGSLGIELDTRLSSRLFPNSLLDVVYGKTSSNETDSSISKPTLFNTLFSSTRTNYGLVSFTQNFIKMRSRVTVSMRFIDPFANMTDFGIVQANNRRLELKSNHDISKKMSIGLNYREDRNNLDHNSDSTLLIVMYGTNISGEVFNKLNYFGSLNYLIQDNNREQSSSFENTNYMASAGLNVTLTPFGYNTVLSMNYSSYKLTTVNQNGNYTNYGLEYLVVLDSCTNTLTLNRFISNTDLLGYENSLIIGDEFKLKFKKTEMLAGLKMGITNTYGNQFGGKLEISTAISKSILWKIGGEKFVLGNFYNSYDLQRFKKFPYVLTTSIKYLIK